MRSNAGIVFARGETPWGAARAGAHRRLGESVARDRACARVVVLSNAFFT